MIFYLTFRPLSLIKQQFFFVILLKVILKQIILVTKIRFILKLPLHSLIGKPIAKKLCFYYTFNMVSLYYLLVNNK